MAAFLQDHAGGKALVAPIAAHEGMSLMPVAHLLDGLHVHRVPDHARVDQFLDLLIKSGVAQNMADRHLPSPLLSDAGQLAALIGKRRDRLFEQQIIILEQRVLGLHIMAAVGRADQHHVGQPRLGQHLLRGGIAGVVRNAGQLFHALQLFRIDVRGSDDLRLVRHFQQYFGIGVLASGAAAGHGHGNRSVHHDVSPLFISF